MALAIQQQAGERSRTLAELQRELLELQSANERLVQAHTEEQQQARAQLTCYQDQVNTVEKSREHSSLFAYETAFPASLRYKTGQHFHVSVPASSAPDPAPEVKVVMSPEVETKEAELGAIIQDQKAQSQGHQEDIDLMHKTLAANDKMEGKQKYKSIGSKIKSKAKAKKKVKYNKPYMMPYA